MRTKVTTSAIRIGVADTARCVIGVLAPMLAQGAIRRRNRVVRLIGRLDLERRGAELLHRLRYRYGPGPLRLAVPGRPVAVVLAADDVERLLAGSPEPFAAATTEKVAALRHFQPHGVLASRGRARTARRLVNERALDTGRPLHRIAGAVADKVRGEVGGLDGGVLDWASFGPMADRVARRIVLGDAARDDTGLTADLDRLRNAANWAYLRPRDERSRHRFQLRVDAYAARAEPGSLVGALADVPADEAVDEAVDAAVPADEAVDAAGQVPHWLFAFDAARITAFRTLALLGSDPVRRARAVADAAPALPYLRACALDTVRLWPTTLVVLRESTRETYWGRARLPGRTTFVVPSSFHHRDPTATPHADEFCPEEWLDGDERRLPSVFPFSGGPARCPGRDVVLLTVSTLLSAVLGRFPALRTVAPPRLPLPYTLDHTSLRMVTDD